MSVTLYLSGGANNNEPSLSLGGEKSAVVAPSDLFGDLPLTAFSAGGTFYRCVYVQAVEAKFNLHCWISSETPSALTTMSIVWGSSGINEEEPEVASHTTAPSGLVFSSPQNQAVAIGGGHFVTGQYRALWIRLVVQIKTAAPENFSLTFDSTAQSNGTEISPWLVTPRTLPLEFFGVAVEKQPFDTTDINAPADTYGINRYRVTTAHLNRCTELTYLHNAQAQYSDFNLWVNHHAALGADVMFQGYLNIFGAVTELSPVQWNTVETAFTNFLAQASGRVKYILIGNEPLFAGSPDDDLGEATTPGWPSRSATLYAQYVRVIKQMIDNSEWAGEIFVIGPELISLDANRRSAGIFALEASAAGPDIGYGDGAGTTLLDWLDIFSYHGHHTDGDDLYDPNDGGRSLILSMQSELANAGWTGPLWDTQFYWTLGGDARATDSYEWIREQMARRFTAEVATGVGHHNFSEWSSTATNSYFNDDNAAGIGARDWWLSWVGWWRSSPVARIALLADLAEAGHATRERNKIRVTLQSGSVLTIPDGLFDGTLGTPSTVANFTLAATLGSLTAASTATVTGGGTISMVGVAKIASAASTQLLSSPTWSNVAGNPLVVMVSWEGAFVTSAISDTAGNVYTALNLVTHPDSILHGRIFYCLDPLANAANVVTLKLGDDQEPTQISYTGTYQVPLVDAQVGEFIYQVTLATSGSVRENVIMSVTEWDEATAFTFTAQGSGNSSITTLASSSLAAQPGIVMALARSHVPQSAWAPTGTGYSKSDLTYAGNIYATALRKVLNAASSEAPGLTGMNSGRSILASVAFADSGMGGAVVNDAVQLIDVDFTATTLTSSGSNSSEYRLLRGGDFDTGLFSDDSQLQWVQWAIIGDSNPLDISNYMETSVKSVTSRANVSTSALSLNIKVDAPQTIFEQLRVSDSQLAGLAGIDGRVEPIFYQRIYVKFDVNELARAVRVGTAAFFHRFWEMNCSPDYRMAVQLQYNGSKLFWSAYTDNNAGGGRLYSGNNTTVDVVLSSHATATGWHKFEAHVDRPAGIFRVAVDGQNILSVTGGNLFGVTGNIINDPMFMNNYCPSAMGVGFSADDPM
jgi:hypothetical protein